MEIAGLFLMLPLFLLLPSALPVSDHAAFVYKTCAPQTLITGSPSSLLAQLAHQSWHSSFFNTAQTAAMSALFQCRQDMSSQECGSCVNSAAHMLETACGPSTAAARVQLEGCYAQYETRQVSGGWETGQVLYKECGDAYGDKATTEAALEKRLMSMDIVRSGYYRGNYDSVEMTAQCDDDLDECECRECLGDAVLQCPASLSARIFLAKCSIAYLFHPIPTTPAGNSSSSSKRIAAIVVAGCVAVLLGLLFLSFFRSRYSKRHYYY